MSQGRVIDIMIIAFLQLTVLQFLERHTDHRNLDGIYTDVFLSCLRQEIFGGNLF